MQKLFLILALSFATIFTLTRCGFDCVDKKTGMHKSSQTMEEAQKKELFKFEFIADKTTFQLDSGLIFNIKKAWVESSWSYECIDNRAEVVKDSSYQFVIDADYNGNIINSNYWLENNHLGAVLSFDYTGQDTIQLVLYKRSSYTLIEDKMKINTIDFIRRKVSR